MNIYRYFDNIVLYGFPALMIILVILPIVGFSCYIFSYQKDVTYLKENNCEFLRVHHSVYEYKCGDKKFYSDVDPTVLSH